MMPIIIDRRCDCGHELSAHHFIDGCDECTLCPDFRNPNQQVMDDADDLFDFQEVMYESVD